jgi:hypothetical protein
MTHLPQGLPYHISQETDHDMRLHPFLLLMPDRPDRQVLFLNTKRCFHLGELDIGFPKVFGAPFRHIAEQQVTSFAQRSPFPPRFGFRLGYLSAPVCAGPYRDMDELLCSRILRQQLPDPARVFAFIRTHRPISPEYA